MAQRRGPQGKARTYSRGETERAAGGFAFGPALPASSGPFRCFAGEEAARRPSGKKREGGLSWGAPRSLAAARRGERNARRTGGGKGGGEPRGVCRGRRAELSSGRAIHSKAFRGARSRRQRCLDRLARAGAGAGGHERRRPAGGCCQSRSAWPARLGPLFPAPPGLEVGAA